VAGIRGVNALLNPVQTQLDAYNDRDVERFIACYANDCIFEDGAGNRLMSGHAEMRSRYTTLFAASPTLHCRLVRRTCIGQYVIDEEHISGRVPEMKRAVVIYRVEGGRIKHVRFLRDDA
jgi:hypothetical protein